MVHERERERERDYFNMKAYSHRSNAAAASPVKKRKQTGKTVLYGVPFDISERRERCLRADYDARCAPGSKK